MKTPPVKMNQVKPLRFTWRDIENVRDFFKKLEEVRKHAAKSKLQLP